MFISISISFSDGDFYSKASLKSEKEEYFVMSSFSIISYIRSLGRFAAVAIIAMGTNASAGIIVDITDDGDDLVVNVSGSFNYGTFSSFTAPGTTLGMVGMQNPLQYIVSNNLQGIPITEGVRDVSNWSGMFFGSATSGNQIMPLTSITGETFGGWRLDSGSFIVPKNYVSGTVWESSARVVGPITLKPASGSYATFTMNETGDTFTMRYNSSFTPGGEVPEPSSALVVGILGIVGYAGNRRRRRRLSVA